MAVTLQAAVIGRGGPPTSVRARMMPVGTAPPAVPAERTAFETTVDVALVLAADTSGSISNRDLGLQFRSYAQAITSSAFLRAVRSGPHGRAALAFVAWSSAGRQDQLVPWTLIDNISAAAQFATTLLRAPGPVPGYTSISGAIDYAQEVLSACEFAAERRIIDISGDGSNNDGRAVRDARDDAVVVGITINGLPLVRAESDIATYYAENVIGGPGAFVIVAENSDAFPASILKKLVTEVAIE
jgi:hypothetical protein